MILSAPRLSHQRILIIIVSGLVGVNLLSLDIVTLYNAISKKKSIPPVIIQNTYNQSSASTPSGKPATQSGVYVADCVGCSDKINNAFTAIKDLQLALIASGAGKPTPIPSLVPTSTPSVPPTPTPISTSSASIVKEIYVPLGTGFGTTTAFTDVPGIQAYIDTTLYPPIKTVTFEISAHTPTGNQTVDVQLYDDTLHNAIAGTDLNWSGGGEQILTSPAINLDSGRNLYSVQIKTQLGFQTIIDSARVHIVLY